jgi:pilin isopeptide linkage protein
MIPTVIVSELYWGMVSTTTGERQKQKQATGSQGAAANTIDDEEVENMKVKKLISGALALGLAMSMGLTAFAADGDTTVAMTYKAENADTTSPKETFKFTVTAKSVTDAGTKSDGQAITVADAPKLTLEDAAYDGGAAGNTDKMTKALAFSVGSAEFPGVGIYTYEITQTDNKVWGVTYASATYKLVVTVTNGTDGKLVKTIGIHTEQSGDVKTNTIENKYSAGSLSVKKEVTGNLGDKKKEFEVIVTFDATGTATDGSTTKTVNSVISYTEDGVTKTIEGGWSDKKAVTIKLHDQETVTFTNIPYGVKYTIKEADYSSEKYTATYNENTVTISAKETSEVITNSKTGDVDTGINLDSLPYIMMLAIAGVGLVVFAAKKRGMRED